VVQAFRIPRTALRCLAQKDKGALVFASFGEGRTKSVESAGIVRIDTDGGAQFRQSCWRGGGRGQKQSLSGLAGGATSTTNLSQIVGFPSQGPALKNNGAARPKIAL
jgi:hypothetical protein